MIRMYSSSPPPMEDGAEEDDDEFGDFGTFSAVPNSISFTEFDTPTTFNQTQALSATSPPELINNRGVMGFNHSSSNGTHSTNNELFKANGHVGSGPSERTDVKKVLSSSLDFSVSEPADCNGGDTEVLTNGFATFDIQGNPFSQNSVHTRIKETSTEDDFADFAAFSNAEGHLCQTANEDLDNPTEGSCLAEVHCNTEQGTTSEDDVRDTNRTGPNTSDCESISVPAEAPGGSCNTDRGSHTDSQQRDVASTSEAVCTNKPLTLNGLCVADRDNSKDGKLSPDTEVEQLDEKGSENETETETETSFGRPLSTDALEEYGDISTTGSAPSPPLQGEMATPADHSQLVEDDDDDEDFGDFGDAGSFSGHGFADFEQLQSSLENSAPAQEAANTEDDDFGNFNSPKFHSSGIKGEDGGEFADFPVSDSFGNFSSAVEGADGKVDAGWSAFGEQPQAEGESWAAFSIEQSVAPPADGREEEEEEEEEWQESEAPAVGEESSRTDSQLVSTGKQTGQTGNFTRRTKCQAVYVSYREAN